VTHWERKDQTRCIPDGSDAIFARCENCVSALVSCGGALVCDARGTFVGVEHDASGMAIVLLSFAYEIWMGVRCGWRRVMMLEYRCWQDGSRGLGEVR
jgi:hypothetical protein